MNGSGKITTAHRDRLAVIYLRQSSMAQVREHTESTTRQYGLAEESVRRVCSGEVGAIFGIEISRLARSAPRWRG